MLNSESSQPCEMEIARPRVYLMRLRPEKLVFCPRSYGQNHSAHQVFGLPLFIPSVLNSETPNATSQPLHLS